MKRIRLKYGLLGLTSTGPHSREPGTGWPVATLASPVLVHIAESLGQCGHLGRLGLLGRVEAGRRDRAHPPTTTLLLGGKLGRLLKRGADY